MIRIISSNKSAVNVSFNIISNDYNDYLTVRKISDNNKCIKFSCLKKSDSTYHYEIIFRTKNLRYESFEKELISSDIYDNTLN